MKKPRGRPVQAACVASCAGAAERAKVAIGGRIPLLWNFRIWLTRLTIGGVVLEGPILRGRTKKAAASAISDGGGETL